MVEIDSTEWLRRYGKIRTAVFDRLEQCLAESGVTPEVMDVCMLNFHRGKCIRGIMSFMVYMMTNHDKKKLRNKIDAAISFGAAPEAYHIASLVHDDIIDMSETRRGDPTVWHKYGGNVAVAAGDVWMFAPVFEDLIRITPVTRLGDVIRELFRSGLVMSIGEIKDSLESDVNVSGAKKRSGVNEYLNIINEKTIPLVRASAILPALANGCDEDQILALRSYGNYVGYAFQIRDDVIDIIGDEKKAMKDLRKNVEIGSNFVLSLYNEKYGEIRRKDIKLLKKGILSDRMYECNLETQKFINKCIKLAIKSIDIFEYDKYKKGLIDTAVFCGTRER